MTANPPLPLPRLARHPSWYLPLLLPALPALGGWLTDAAGGAAGSMLLILLLTVGATLAFGGAAWVEHSGWAARKEIGLLRTPWLASLFLCQIPLLFGRDLEDLASMLFFASCALIASVPFGAEFQQRTLASLLSQPIRREVWWNLKLGLLAAALASHTLIFQLSALATGHTLDTPRVLGLLAGSAVLWVTTPWWTLRMRGLLAGLVISIAAPLVTLALLLAGIDALDRYAGLLDADRGGAWILRVVIGIGAVVYTGGAWSDGRRRWHQLEAMDTPSGEAEMLPHLGWRRSGSKAGSQPQRRSRWSQRLRTELRLLMSPLALGALAVLLGLLRFASRDVLIFGEYASGAVLAVCCAGILLAGALPISEERRIGTLGALLLEPVSRATLWWFKLAASGLVAVSIATVAGLAFADRVGLYPFDELLSWGTVLGVLFLSGFLASSVCASSLRALVTGLGVGSVWVAMLATPLALSARFAEQASEQWRERALREPEKLQSEVRQMTPDELASLEQVHAGTGMPMHVAVLVGTLGAGAAIPGLLALVFARLNFIRPPSTPRAAILQFAACLTVTGVCSAIGLRVAASGTALESRARMVGSVRDVLAWEEMLSPGERLLWQQHRAGPLLYTRSVRIRLEPDGVTRASQPLLESFLPLNPAERRFILRYGVVSEEIRQALRDEDAKEPTPEATIEPGDPDFPPPIRRWRNMARPGVNVPLPPIPQQRQGTVPAVPNQTEPAPKPPI